MTFGMMKRLSRKAVLTRKEKPSNLKNAGLKKITAHYVGVLKTSSFHNMKQQLSFCTNNMKSTLVVCFAILSGLVLGTPLRAEDSYISQYQGGRLYSWDGQYLSRYQGSRLFEWDGEYLSAYQGSRLYERDGEYISEYQGSRILEINGRYISQYQGNRLFEWDGEYLSRYQEGRIFEIQGSIPLPVIALLAAGML